MQKTTVYLSDEQVAALKRRSAATGKSQSELIREGVSLVTEGVPRRVFHSMGSGRGGGQPFDPDAYLREHWPGEIARRSGLEPPA